MWVHMQNFNPQSDLEYIEMHTYAFLPISSKSHEEVHRIQPHRCLKIHYKYENIKLHHALNLSGQWQESVMIWGSYEGFNDLAFSGTLRQAPSPNLLSDATWCLDSHASRFAINSSSAFGRQFRARWACDTDWNLLSPFWRARFSPCHYEFVKNHV